MCLLIAAFGFFLTGTTDIVLGIQPIVEAANNGENLFLPIAIPILELVVTATLGFLTLRLFYEDYRLLPLHWVMYSLFLFIISGGVYLMANGWLSGGEIVTNVLELLVLVFYSIGFIITFISYRKAKKEGTL